MRYEIAQSRDPSGKKAWVVVDTTTGAFVYSSRDWNEANNRVVSLNKAESVRTDITKSQAEYKNLINKSYGELQQLAETKAARQGGSRDRMLQNAMMAMGEDPARVQALMGRSEAATQRSLQDVLRGLQAQKTEQLAGAKRFEIGTDLDTEKLGLTRQSLADAMDQFNKSQKLEYDKIQAQLDMQPAWWEGVLGDIAGGLSEAATLYFLVGCWIAEEIFGVDDIRTHKARFYVNSDQCPAWLYAGYMKHGRKIAEKVRKYKLLKWVLRPVFEYFAYRGGQLLSKDARTTPYFMAA